MTEEQGPVTGGHRPVPEREEPVAGLPAPGAGPVAGVAARGPGPVRLFRFLVYGLVLVSSATQFALVPIVPAYAHRFALSGFQQGMLLGATGLATLAVAVPAGSCPIGSARAGSRSGPAA